MPSRALTASKRPHGAANHRDTRHENGLVIPGKRVQKQKSHGQLDLARTDSTPSTPPSTPPSLNGAGTGTGNGIGRPEDKMPELRRLSITASESSMSESFENHRRIDVNAAKNPAVHRDLGPMSLALTVLRSLPLYDTIAILIVLLQIPPTLLSLIHFFFAALTFVPPSTSGVSGMSFTDIFEGTLGTPSVATIVVVDLIVLLVWLFLWSPLQEVALDLAQSVIALTLGGGTTGRESMRNVVVSVGTIGVLHLVKNSEVKQSGLRSLFSSRFGTDSDDPMESVPQRKGPYGWIRSILAIHILTQGVVRFIRDWYVRREKRDVSSSSIGDPEAGKAEDVPTSHVQTTDSESLPTNTASSKKKRKQSAQVRIRQPLWAALASTKIVMVKEYETSHTAAESVGTNATDVNNLGNAPFDSEANRVWITYVGSDEIFFSASYFPSHTSDNSEIKDSCGIDYSKPFFVRVNKTIWQPTRIIAIAEEGRETRWSGEIFGLAPMSNYQVEFVSTLHGPVIFSTSVRTLQPPTEVVGRSPNPQVSGRPGSPITTLKTSIASSEVKLGEERIRQKRERKDQRAKLNHARKEIEKLISNISSSGGNDDRLRQKVQQSNLQMKQAEDALHALDANQSALDHLPSDNSSFTSTKRAYQAAKDTHKKTRCDYESTKLSTERDLAALTAEVASLQQKRERMQLRLAKLHSEHDRIADANERGLNEAQRKTAERHAKTAERTKFERMYIDNLHGLNARIVETTANLHALIATIEALQQAEMYAAAQQAQAHVLSQSQAHSHASGSPTTSVPSLNMSYSSGVADIPEGGLPLPNSPWASNLSASHLPPPGLFLPGSGASSGSVLASASASNYSSSLMAHPRNRGRSSSMLSNVSGFTQSSGDASLSIPMSLPQTHVSASSTGFGPASVASPIPSAGRLALEEKDRQSSSGSGGSVGEPRSPVVGSAKMGAK